MKYLFEHTKQRTYPSYKYLELLTHFFKEVLRDNAEIELQFNKPNEINVYFSVHHTHTETL